MVNPERGAIEKNANRLKWAGVGALTAGVLIGLPTLTAIGVLVGGGSWWYERSQQSKRSKSQV